MQKSFIIFALHMKKLIYILLVFLAVPAQGRGWIMDMYGTARLAGTSGEYMPFWSRTGEDGILPLRSSGLVTAGADVSYRHSNGIFFAAGANLAGALAQKSVLNHRPVYGMIDRLYVSGGWKMLHLDVGMKPRERELSELTVSGGDFMYSRNARNMPGINAWSDWIYFEKGHWVGIRGNLAHYHMIDDRAVSRAMVHHKSVALKLALGHKVELMAGFNHYAQWGGISATDGSQGQSFRDYVKVFFARRGDESDSLSDQMNIFGNHLGSEWLRVAWKANDFTMTFQYDKPFEDNSGMRLQNVPDGIWTLQFAMADRDALVTDVIYELISTTWQSGDRHDRPATEEEMKNQDPSDPYYGKIVLGGMDNYFANSPYTSGWTHFGRIIGLPLIVPAISDGQVVRIMNNRVRGHHIAFAGVISHKVPYRFKATYTENYGTYSAALPDRPWQLSLALEADALTHLPVVFSAGIYSDVGRFYPDSFGLTLKVSYKGSRRL